MEFLRRHRKSVFLLLIYLSISLLYQWTNRPIGTVRILWTPLDDLIPFWPGFILIYHSWYPFIIAGMLMMFLRRESDFQRLILHLIIAQLMAILIFVLFQTEVIRADITGGDVFSRLVAWTYRIDQPYNGFPSIHVLTSLITAWYFAKTFFEKKGLAIFYVFYSGLIILSTLFVKQHMVWDIPGALAVALLTYPISRWLYKICFKEEDSYGAR